MFNVLKLKKSKKAKSDEEILLEKIKKIINSGIELARWVLEDDTIIEAESFEAGNTVFIVSADPDVEPAPLPVGTYTVDDGTVIVVEEEGIIASITALEEEEDGGNANTDTAQMQKKIKKLSKQKKELEVKLSKVPGSGFVNSDKNKKHPKQQKTVLARTIKGRLNDIYVENVKAVDNKGIKLATTATVSSNYTGTEAGEYIGEAFKEAPTLGRNLINVIPDVDFQVSLKKIEYGDGRVDYACGFSPLGSVTLSEKLLTPKKIKNEQELCKEDFRQIWSSATMGFSAHNDRMPTDVEAALLSEIMGDTSEAIEEEIWQGDETVNGEIGGFIKKFDADGDIIKANNGIVPLEAPIDKSNVVAELEKIMNAIPLAIRTKADLVFGVSPDVFSFYTQALINPQITNGLGGQPLTVQYGIYVLEQIVGLPANTIVVYQTKNLSFGTGLMADLNEVRVKDMDDTDLSGTVRYKVVYTGGTQYVISPEIIWYLSTTIIP